MNDEQHYQGPERRRPITNGELAILKGQLLESIYADIGKKGIKGALWVFGAVVTAFLAWLGLKGHFTIGP